MAGLSGKQVIVDVVAISELLVPSAVPELPTEEPEVLEPALIVPTQLETSELQPWPSCALGHQNQPDARFCAACGLPMGAAAPFKAEAQRPVPAGQLSAEEAAAREEQHKIAMAATAQFERQQPAFQPTEGEAVLIHFVADGLTAFGQVWYRGQELEIGPTHPRWSEALSWITLTRFQQVERWGEQKFDFGPWPGRRSYADAMGSFQQLTIGTGDNASTYAGPGEAELRAADDAERRRARAVPAPTLL